MKRAAIAAVALLLIGCVTAPEPAEGPDKHVTFEPTPTVVIDPPPRHKCKRSEPQKTEDAPNYVQPDGTRTRGPSGPA
jgi:hypothetical protein